MKKIATVIMCIALLFAFASCAFMPSSQVKKVVKEFGTPQAEMTLTYKPSGNDEITLVIVYDLLLDKAPITTINFINLVNDGFYTDALIDMYDSSYGYFVAGRYSYTMKGEDTTPKYYKNNSGITMVGEFASNGYSKPKGGYGEFSQFALAMYHQRNDTGEYFNSANGSLIISADTTLDSSNYAVFATVSSVTAYVAGDKVATYPSIPSTYYSRLTSSSSQTTRDVYDNEGNKESIKILGLSSTVPRYVFSIKMLGDADWSKLPQV